MVLSAPSDFRKPGGRVPNLPGSAFRAFQKPDIILPRRDIMSPPQEQDPGIARLDPMPGRVIAGNFRIDKLIGAGAMGNVYKALAAVAEQAGRGEDPPPRTCTGTRRLVARFKREAKSASLLNHPNSIQIIDSGRGQRRHALHRDGAA